MGLGKTVQTLALLVRDREEGVTRPVLLVCPMSVVGNWSREAARFAPHLPLLIHHGPNRAKSKASLKKAAAKAAMVLTSYGLLARDRDLFEPLTWSGVILDEAQMIKNPNTKTAQAARAVTADYRVALTGTPVENHVGDLWALGQFLNPGLLGSAAAFRREFFTPIQRHGDKAAADRLKRLTGPFLLRRLKTDPTVIGIAPGKVTAKVQGSRPQPYSVVIEIERLAAKDWDKLVGELNTQAAFAAKLLSGEMPKDIETAFATVGLSLFPKSLNEIKTDCSCPDWSNPCKHIAAVYYLIGEEFDRDPFLLLRLRGTQRDVICGRLTAGSGPKAADADPPATFEPVPSDAATFWASGPLPAELYDDVRLPPVDAAGPKRLGGFPFWRGADRFLDTLVPTYSAAARRALTVFEAETPQ